MNNLHNVIKIGVRDDKIDTHLKIYGRLSAPEKNNYFLNLLKMYFNSICLSERRETEASFLSTPHTLFF